MLKAVKVRLYPNEEQRGYISRLLGCCRLVYNECLSYRKSEYEDNGNSVGYKETSSYCTHTLKDEKPFIKEANSKVLQQKLRDLDKAYVNFFKHGAGFPSFKKRGVSDTCRFPKDAIIGVKGNRVSLTKPLRDILFKCSERDERYLNRHREEITSATLERTASGRYTLSVLVNYEPKTTQADGCVGIDLGVKDLVITSNGEKFPNMHFGKASDKRIRRLHRALSRKTKGSNNRNRARLALARAYEKVRNQREWYIHHIANTLTDENQVICVEDLNVSGMMKNHKLAGAIADVSFGELVGFLEWKCKERGRTLVRVGRFFASSKLCHECGYKNDSLTLSDREWTCPRCGKRHDRDVNAAENILSEGLRLLSEGREEFART